MGKITAIKPQSRPGRYNIMVDDTFVLAVSEKVLVDLSLLVGKELDEQRLVDAAKAEDSHKALSSALRLLEVRARSEKEIVDRLKQRGYDESVIKEVILKLHGYGFIDDVEFTSSWIESRSRSHPEGIHKLRSELSLKGITRETIEKAIREISEDTELELAHKALSKRSAIVSSSREERQAAYLRDAGYLARRGFGWSIAHTVLKERYGAIQDVTDE